MENRYQTMLKDIHTPAGLNDRVLFEARRRAAAPVRRKWPVLRIAVCTAAALVLVLGGVSLRTVPVRNAGDGGALQSAGTEAVQGPVTQVLTPAFGLTAYAAWNDASYSPAPDGSIAFSVGEGCTTMECGDFTGCLFQITGENIDRVSLSIDRCGLYRYQSRENLTEEQMAEYRKAMEEGQIAPAAISQRDDGSWYMPEMTALGTSVEEAYDPDARYGFWVGPEEMAFNTGLGITTEAQMDADRFDNALLTVTVTSSDGTEKTQTYRLHSGELKVEFAEDNTIIVLPELAGEDNLFVYGIYATPENESESIS